MSEFRRQSRAASRRGLVWGEVLAVVVVGAILAAVLVVASSRSRAMAQLGESMSNMRVLGSAFAAYGPDYQDRVLGFSWRAGKCPSQFTDLQIAVDNLGAAANQATDIARRRTGNPSVPKVSGWIPHPRCWNFVVADYLDLPLPSRLFVSPGDSLLLAQSSDPANWSGTSINYRRALATSYELNAASWGGPDSGSGAISQEGSTYSLFFVPSNALSAPRYLSEVAFPGQRALLFERYQFFYGPRVAFFMSDQARIPVAMFDGSIAVRSCAFANRGWKPQSPLNVNPSEINYEPSPDEPQPVEGSSSQWYFGRLRYTRAGLAGRDFDGPEVP